MIEFSLFVPRVDTVMRTEMEELAKTLRDIALKLRGEYELTQAMFGEALISRLEKSIVEEDIDAYMAGTLEFYYGEKE